MVGYELLLGYENNSKDLEWRAKMGYCRDGKWGHAKNSDAGFVTTT